MPLTMEQRADRWAEYTANIHASYKPASYVAVRAFTGLHDMDVGEVADCVRDLIIGHEIADESDWAAVTEIMKWVYSILWQETQAGGAA